MKLKKLILPLLLTSFLAIGLTCIRTESIKIRTTFNIKDQYCSVLTNGVAGFDNRKFSYAGRGSGTSSTNSLLFLENGENEISLELGSLSWFSREKMSNDERMILTPNSGCKVDMVRFNKNGQTTTLASINIIVNDKGIPVATPETEKNTTHDIILAEQAFPGHIDPKFYGERYFPEKMQLHKFSKRVIIDGIPKWEWLNATPFDESEIQSNQLKGAYTEIAKVINMHSREQLKKFHSIALRAWSKATGDSEDDILLSQYTKEEIEGKEVTIDPINWDDYSIRVMNKGRLVQFYNKSKPTYSPLTYHSFDAEGHKTMGFYAPIFSLINGKFVVVL